MVKQHGEAVTPALASSLTAAVPEGWASTTRFPDGWARSQHRWTVQLVHLRLLGMFEALKTPRCSPGPTRVFTRGEVPEGRAQQRGGPEAGPVPPSGSGGGMRLPELCLALLYAAGSGTESPRAAREWPPAPGAAAGRGEPGAARVDPRQAWMLLAGSPGRGSGARGRGGPGADMASAGGKTPGKAAQASPTVPEELLRELQLLLRGMAKEQAKMCRRTGEGWKKEEESSKGNPQAGAQRPVEAAFYCQTREDTTVEQKMWQELGLFYTPEREEMFHRGPGLNLTSGQYTAPIAGYYTFTTTLHIVRRELRRKGQACRGSRLRVLICVQSRCQHNSHLETISWLESSGDLFTISVTGTLYLQAGQYASVFVDNTAGSSLTVQSGSYFSAVLLGV